MFSKCPPMEMNIIQNNMLDTRKDRKFFTSNEDELLKMIAWRYGAKNWILIASMIPGKTARQCRDRYMNYLAPGLCHSEWTKDEDDLLKKLYKEYGPKWSLISKQLPNRSPINVKNRWAHFLGKKISSASSSLKLTNLNTSSCTCSSDTDGSDYVDISKPPQKDDAKDIKSIDINSFLSSMSNSKSNFQLSIPNLLIPQLQKKDRQSENPKTNRIIFPSLMENDLPPNLSISNIAPLCI